MEEDKLLPTVALLKLVSALVHVLVLTHTVGMCEMICQYIHQTYSRVCR